MKQIFIRADSSHVIGTGHIMRCITLISTFALKNLCHIVFICRAFEGSLIAHIRTSGFLVVCLPVENEREPSANDTHQRGLGADFNKDAQQTISAITSLKSGMVDLLIVDHYSIDIKWESLVRPYAKNILVLDDLANRRHDCNFLIDQTFQRLAADYQHLVPPSALIFTGSQYALLRAQFSLNPSIIVQKRREKVSLNRILIMLGGTDPNNLTLELLQCLQRLDSFHITVVMGETAGHQQKVSDYCDNYLNINYLCAVNDVASLMLEHDICIGASGSTSWERCACGLPSIVLIQAENQLKVAHELERIGAVQILHDPLSINEIKNKLAYWRHSSSNYLEAVNACLKVCDGKGVSRIMTYLSGL